MPDNSGPETSGILEIEEVFVVSEDVGDNGTVGADTFNAGASAGQHVRLFDTDDALSFDFEITEAGAYDLAFRLRVGDASDNGANLTQSYQIRP